jgi:hypothetical protein
MGGLKIQSAETKEKYFTLGNLSNLRPISDIIDKDTIIEKQKQKQVIKKKM